MQRLLCAALLVLSACSTPSEPADKGVDAPKEPSSARLDTSYEYEPYPGSVWYDPNGDEVPEETNVINAITGPDHCDWEAGVMMHVGWPVGRDAEDISQSRQFIRDPKKVFPQESLMTTFDENAEVPGSAMNTGYRTDFMELWLDPDDHTAAYLVFADHAERWPRAKDPIACA